MRLTSDPGDKPKIDQGRHATVLAFVVALSITAALIPLLARVAPYIGLNDAPGPRKVHSAPVPRVGGIAMAVGILVPALPDAAR